MNQETIAAIITPLGEAGLGAIRISGPLSLPILKKIFVSSSVAKYNTHQLCHGWIELEKGKRVDEAMAVFFKSPKTYTGEDVVEIFSHGGPAILKLILNHLLSSGARLAERGEFTKRAFLNGKIDLVQAEAVIGLVRAKTEEAVYLAEAQLEGRLSIIINSQRIMLIETLAAIEADIDFSEDLAPLNFSDTKLKIKAIIKHINSLIATSSTGEIMFQGALVSIVGRPNVGKSSLLNALLKEDKAIVTDVPGTTRDPVEGLINIKGILLRLVDTAGLRDVKDGGRNKAERFGIERAKAVALKASLQLLVLDQAVPLQKEDLNILKLANPKRALVVINKNDQRSRLPLKNLRWMQKKFKVVSVSALSGIGIDMLEKEIYNWFCLSQGFSLDSDAVVTTARQKQALTRCLAGLLRAEEAIEGKMAGDFVSIDLKAAIVALGEITGEEVTDEILDKVFSEFCVGK